MAGLINQPGSFYQWYAVFREESYEPDQAESMAERASRSGQLLPDWYVQPELNQLVEGVTAENSHEAVDCGADVGNEDIPF